MRQRTSGESAPAPAAPDAVTALEVFARRHAAFVPRVLAVSHAVERVARTDPDTAGTPSSTGAARPARR
ncbi:hypothetical protein [Spirillospora sp. NPDC047279]|uniref:hypothetical protein n=1 Tax=Spirillospora sp. NPDC047279 TaxID=3155478 RepID=UPI0033E4CDB9